MSTTSDQSREYISLVTAQTILESWRMWARTHHVEGMEDEGTAYRAFLAGWGYAQAMQEDFVTQMHDEMQVRGRQHRVEQAAGDGAIGARRAWSRLYDDHSNLAKCVFMWAVLLLGWLVLTLFLSGQL